ncbi:putative neurogenic locus notch-like protein 1-like [Apostichopus japonicus]|uniref:Putative neurogenic locus notch-like protein 1-like n=1 Tax=Stichopus japonicus TaxID=307972 RepID=A0A2G8KFG3_STIJA|nr:putative neurogenic locus notch-like protein 1-like [Apostichopus japonicus]
MPAEDVPVECPAVMCFMWCPYGYRKDQDGCDTCICNEQTEIHEGECPVPPAGSMGACTEMCDHDGGCAANQKCCSNGCGHVCMDALKEVKPGACPVVDATQMGVCMEGCANDGNCTGNQKCCSNGCGHVCTDPADKPVVRPGTCPVNTKLGEGMLGACVNMCDDDSVCSDGQKCCSNGCGRVCITVSEVPAGCDEMRCMMFCEFGPKIGEDGCALCACKDPPSVHVGPALPWLPIPSVSVSSSAPTTMTVLPPRSAAATVADTFASKPKTCQFMGYNQDSWGTTEVHGVQPRFIEYNRGSWGTTEVHGVQPRFMGYICHVQHPGSCPVNFLPEGGFGICAEMCSGDEDCSSNEKCCSNGCGHACLAAVDVPAICPEVMCMMFCEHGYEVDEEGCNTCVCKEPVDCPDMYCLIACEHALKLHEHGCKTCFCLEQPSKSISTSNATPSPSLSAVKKGGEGGAGSSLHAPQQSFFYGSSYVRVCKPSAQKCSVTCGVNMDMTRIMMAAESVLVSNQWCASQSNAAWTVHLDSREIKTVVNDANATNHQLSIPGVCPIQLLPEGSMGICAQTCSSDRDCNSNEKCCSNGCGHVCMVAAEEPEVKPGFCPAVESDQMGICTHECSNDFGCPDDKKCCSNGCGMVCIDAAIPTPEPKPGTCPATSGLGPCLTECSSDHDCTENKKCCSNGCGMVCSAPAPVIKEGSCPALEPGTIGLCVQDCYDDGGCPDNMKCCSNGCGHVCIKPAPVIKQGSCPAVPDNFVGICINACSDDSGCSGEEKCCSNGCGMTCQAPVKYNKYINVEGSPLKSQYRLNKSGRVVPVQPSELASSVPVQRNAGMISAARITSSAVAMDADTHVNLQRKQTPQKDQYPKCCPHPAPPHPLPSLECGPYFFGAATLLWSAFLLWGVAILLWSVAILLWVWPYVLGSSYYSRGVAVLLRGVATLLWGVAIFLLGVAILLWGQSYSSLGAAILLRGVTTLLKLGLPEFGNTEGREPQGSGSMFIFASPLVVLLGALVAALACHHL